MRLGMLAALLVSAVPAASVAKDRARLGGTRHGGMRDLAPEDQKAIHDYKLSTSATDKLLDAGQRLRTAAEKDPAMKQDNPMQSAATIDDSVKRMEAHPQAVSALKSAGLTPRDFVVGTYALMTATMWSSMRKSYPQAEVPSYVNPDNMKFVDEHPEVLKKFQAAWGRGPHGGHE